MSIIYSSFIRLSYNLRILLYYLVFNVNVINISLDCSYNAAQTYMNKHLFAYTSGAIVGKCSLCIV